MDLFQYIKYVSITFESTRVLRLKEKWSTCTYVNMDCTFVDQELI